MNPTTAVCYSFAIAIKVGWALKWVVPALLTLCLGCSRTKPDEDAQNAAAIVVVTVAENDHYQPELPDTLKEDENPGDDFGTEVPVAPVLPEVRREKDRVWLICAPFPCDPCETRFKEIGASGRFEPVKRTCPPEMLPVVQKLGYPVACWQIGKKWWYVEKWVSVEDMAERYDFTMKGKK